MRCEITRSAAFKTFCIKRKCNLYPCSQLKAAHKPRLKELLGSSRFRIKEKAIDIQGENVKEAETDE